ncbi:MAG: hypothetical protein AYK23_01930 [Candidatus Proteinoplasmatales archaeon SG8-5]|nr:MAG: hypothetical protein AYK23_01930 [Candidatus Proteinoplasmatales archaeon SG8-5]
MSYEQLDVSKALSHFSHPVAIISVRNGDEVNGMTAAWVAQTSIDPPIGYVSISPLRHTWDMMQKTEHFGVSVLGEGQERIAEIFGTKSGRDTNKFNTLGIDPYLGQEDVPLIPESVAAFVCRKMHTAEIGDHFAVFGEVIEAWKGPENKPLKWFRSKFDI